MPPVSIWNAVLFLIFLVILLAILAHFGLI